jgi:hypothetical protein
MGDNAPTPIRHKGLDGTRGKRQVKLTLELDNGEKNTINLVGEVDASDRPETLKGMAKLLDLWATERDKNKDNAKLP